MQNRSRQSRLVQWQDLKVHRVQLVVSAQEGHEGSEVEFFASVERRMKMITIDFNCCNKDKHKCLELRDSIGCSYQLENTYL